jgi:predicted alpha/beta hydrolase
MQPTHRDLTIPADDGFALAATLTEGDATDGPVTIIASAAAVRRRYYQPFAAALAARRRISSRACATGASRTARAR